MSEPAPSQTTPCCLFELQLQLRQFAQEREWEQFHTPKNLSMALMVEAAELLEHFQWLTPEQSQQLHEEKKSQVSLEIADVFLYLLRLADILKLDILAAARQKIALNRQKYPAQQVWGSAKKYTEY